MLVDVMWLTFIGIMVLAPIFFFINGGILGFFWKKNWVKTNMIKRKKLQLKRKEEDVSTWLFFGEESRRYIESRT